MKVVSTGNRKYEQIEAYLNDLVTKGLVKEGDRLVSERELGRMFKASNVPVRQAMRKFIDQGIMEKIHGKGTFIKQLKKNNITNKIGIIHLHSDEGFFNSSFYMEILSGIQKQARGKKLSLVLHPLFWSQDPQEVFQNLVDDVDGFIIIDMDPSVENKMTHILAEISKPVVMLNYERHFNGVDSVITNSRENSRRLVEYLINLGHRRIVCVYDDYVPNHPNYLNRVNAYKETLQSHDIPVDPGLVLSSRQLTEEKLNSLLKGPDRVTAFFYTASHMVPWVIPYITQELNLKIPEDLSIVSYDNIRECAQHDPPITTSDVPLSDIGKAGMQKILERLEESPRSRSQSTELSLCGNIAVRGSQKRLS